MFHSSELSTQPGQAGMNVVRASSFGCAATFLLHSPQSKEEGSQKVEVFYPFLLRKTNPSPATGNEFVQICNMLLEHILQPGHKVA